MKRGGSPRVKAVFALTLSVLLIIVLECVPPALARPKFSMTPNGEGGKSRKGKNNGMGASEEELMGLKEKDEEVAIEKLKAERPIERHVPVPIEHQWPSLVVYATGEGMWNRSVVSGAYSVPWSVILNEDLAEWKEDWQVLGIGIATAPQWGTLLYSGTASSPKMSLSVGQELGWETSEVSMGSPFHVGRLRAMTTPSLASYDGEVAYHASRARTHWSAIAVVPPGDPDAVWTLKDSRPFHDRLENRLMRSDWNYAVLSIDGVFSHVTSSMPVHPGQRNRPLEYESKKWEEESRWRVIGLWARDKEWAEMALWADGDGSGLVLYGMIVDSEGVDGKWEAEEESGGKVVASSDEEAAQWEAVVRKHRMKRGLGIGGGMMERDVWGRALSMEASVWSLDDYDGRWSSLNMTGTWSEGLGEVLSVIPGALFKQD